MLVSCVLLKTSNIVVFLPFFIVVVLSSSFVVFVVLSFTSSLSVLLLFRFVSAAYRCLTPPSYAAQYHGWLNNSSWVKFWPDPSSNIIISSRRRRNISGGHNLTRQTVRIVDVVVEDQKRELEKGDKILLKHQIKYNKIANGGSIQQQKCGIVESIHEISLSTKWRMVDTHLGRRHFISQLIATIVRICSGV